jgi:hypothetical protein
VFSLSAAFSFLILGPLRLVWAFDYEFEVYESAYTDYKCRLFYLEEA